MRTNVVYPMARRAAFAYVKHGRTIPDPYHYLEEPEGSETKTFVKDQNEAFQSYIHGFEHKDALREVVTAMRNYPRTGAPSLRGGLYYYYHNTGLQNHNILLRQSSIQGSPADAEVVLDPNTLSDDGTTSLSSTAWSSTDKYFAHGLQFQGSDWVTIKVLDVATKQLLPDTIDWVRYSGISWLGDAGFFYTRFPTPASGKKSDTGVCENGTVYFHKLGTDQSDDVLVLEDPDHPKWLLSAEVTDDNAYLLVNVSEGCEPHNQVWGACLPADYAEKPSRLQIKRLVPEFDGEYEYLANDGPKLYLLTTKGAPLKQVVTLDFNDSSRQETLVAEGTSKIDFCVVVKTTLFVVRLVDVKHEVFYAPLATVAGMSEDQMSRLSLPIGSITGMHAKRNSPFVSLSMSSYLLPGRSYYFDVETPEQLTVFRDSKVNGFNPDDFETKQVFVDSVGGARVPMFITSKKGLKLDGSNPTLMYGYGGFNISLTPAFSPSTIAFLSQFNGVYCVANIRGGSEYGEKWHDEGAKFNKMNCFTDFCNAGEYLVEHNYCTRDKLAIHGGSNGGLLVAACANQAPHLFGAVVCSVGVLDMYRFHKFTIGHAWVSDFLDPEVEKEFDYISKYSPIHNVKSNTAYPATLVMTADHDDRVVPAHSLKYLATLQHVNADFGGPFLGRIDVNAGHGAGKPTAKIIAESVDLYAFLATALKAEWNTSTTRSE